MKIIHKKHIHIIIAGILISLVVILLYPFGKRLLMVIRLHNNQTTYGKEIIYSYIDSGDINIANDIINNKYTISRFEPVTIDNILWNEDPFSDIYWRFNYYNLEPVRNLLFAWEKTGDNKYKDKLIGITESFIDNGMNGQYSWDYHGVAFRTMTLIDIREKLLAKNMLPEILSKKIYEALKIHGTFLADPAHFEKDYNHGLDQAAALYLLVVNYPKMDESGTWLSLATDRIVKMQDDIIDSDGVLVENSPYYHLYVLEKFLEISKYLKQNSLKMIGFSEEKIDKMISYVVYMLQPDLTVPTIGASIERQINYFGIYKELAISRPDLLYVLTQGKEGSKPSKLNIQYPESGETIMRSDWSKGENFKNQTQLIFDVGNYRTNHSDFDALSFNLFGAGIALMPDAGLYTYENGPYRSYFHGTKSHNTIVVDNKDQNEGNLTINQPGNVTPGFFEEGDGYVYQSGEHSLYEGVTHKRAITMIENSTIIIIDDLKSESEHTYEQMFHLFPGAKTSSNGLTLKAEGLDPKQSLTIQQFITNGMVLNTSIGNENPPDGLCSLQYKKSIPCYAVSYKQKGKDVSYITVINIGQNTNNVNYSKENNFLTINTKTKTYNIKINRTKEIENSLNINKNFDISSIYSKITRVASLNNYGEWNNTNDNHTQINKPTYSSVGSWIIDPKTGEKKFIPNKKSDWPVDKYIESSLTNNSTNSLEIITPSDDSYVDVAKNVNLNLSSQNIYFKVKIDNTSNLKGLDISLSNNNWEKEVSFNIKEVINYQNFERNNEWIQFGVGKSELRKTELGSWIKNNPTFDWSNIDNILFTSSSKGGKSAKINIKDFTLVPDQKEGRVVIVFDDGWSSVIDASNIMNKYEMKGNVAVITNSIDKRNYLTLNNLKTLQNDFGWNIASHSSLHNNEVYEYRDNNDSTGLDNDIRGALEYLIQNNINSAPNWYIYPDGSTDIFVKNVINKYYKFGRGTFNAPQIFPFAEPLEVGVFPVYSDRATPADVHNAIADTIKYKQTLFLMFHKISEGNPSVYTEFSKKDFEAIIKDLKDQGIKVVTLSELDKENNIPETIFTLHNAIPSQFDLDISIDKKSNILQNVIINGWKSLKEIF